MERLQMPDIQDILYRLRKGESERAIARDLKHSRITIQRYHQFAQQRGYLDPQATLPSLQTLQAQLGEPVSLPLIPSSVLPFQVLVEEWIQQGVEGVAIHQRLQKHHAYTGSYSSVRRFVRQLRPTVVNACVRIETPAGEQAQVDFGTVGRLLDTNTGTRRVLYCFVMTLSYSRHQYLEFVFEQSMATFAACHRNAFAFFGGAPRQIVLDNLKAAVIVAAMEDSVLSGVYRQMAQHYGILVSPCRPRTPQHKGKVESGVHYVKRNFYAAEEFTDLNHVNRAALIWVKEVAGTRLHGTTQQAPLKRFAETEREALLPLPAEAFALLSTLRLTLQVDCHLRCEDSFYSAPFAFVGKRLEVFLFEGSVQIYDGITLLTTHPRATQKGQRLTRNEHYPPEKAIWLQQTPENSREAAVQVGPFCEEVVEHLLSVRPVDNRQAAAKLVALAARVGTVRLEAACARALRFGDPRYRRIKNILDAGLESETDDATPKEEKAPVKIKVDPPHFTHARPLTEIFWEGFSPC